MHKVFHGQAIKGRIAKVTIVDPSSNGITSKLLWLKNSLDSALQAAVAVARHMKQVHNETVDEQTWGKAVQPAHSKAVSGLLGLLGVGGGSQEASSQESSQESQDLMDTVPTGATNPFASKVGHDLYDLASGI